ncbi:6007_t:CDS:1, partial [Dentiscutata erythropus]
LDRNKLKNENFTPEIMKTTELLSSFYGSLSRGQLNNTWRAYRELERKKGKYKKEKEED